MLAHIKTQFKEQPEFFAQFEELETKLKSNEMTSDEVSRNASYKKKVTKEV